MEKFSCSVILLFCSIHLTCATHILFPGESLNSNQSLVSQNGEYNFGFFNQDGWWHNYYIGIWFSTYNEGYIDCVWTGTQTPIDKSQLYALNLSHNGNLILTQFHELIWSTNVGKREHNSTILVLLDTGNLVLCDRTNLSNVIWQSFDHPTNTWLPGASLGYNTINGKNKALSLVSWTNPRDPSPGAYSMDIDNSSGKWGYMVNNKISSTSYFGIFPAWLPIQYNNGLLTISSTQSPRFSVTLDPDGSVNVLKDHIDEVYGSDYCPLNCGPFGLCVLNLSAGNLCKCPYSFHPTSSKEFDVQNYSAGCVRNVSWNCKTDVVLDSYSYTFHQLDNLVQWPYNTVAIAVLSQEDCKNYCLSDCSCVAFASHGGFCYPWYGEILSTVFSDDMLTGISIYIRLAISSPPIVSITNRNNKWIIAEILIAVIVVIAFLLIIWIIVRKFLCIKLVNVDDHLSFYTFQQIKNATRNFSTKLGEGGFGTVFKGRLFDCTEVAVKKLKIVGQEEKQFRAEVQTLGMIQHANLVGLLGFCAEGRRRLLVYEYMSMGALDSHLFKERSDILSWKNRYKISVGVARGLAYLHEQCRECIIHCDIKPENVLLDEQFSPKIADFGLAKLLGREFSRVLTTMRGTIGYLAPEWISGEAITQKADVYSFGMMLFEIISGKRNASKFDNSRYPYFPLYATKMINEGEVLGLLDKKLGGNVNVVELIQACKVAGWCIQDSEAQRPSMGKVVFMLEGVIEVGIPPIPHSLLNLVDAENY